MTERPTRPASTFTSTPSDKGRAYQASGDQTFHEYHYRGSAPPVPPSAGTPSRRKPALYALTGSLTAMAAVLVLLAGAGGTWLLLRSVSSEDTKARADAPRPDAPARPTVPVASSSASPSASRSATSRPSARLAPAAPPTKSSARSEPSPTPATRTPSASVRSSSWGNPAPDKQCRAWVAAGVADVETRPCWRREGDRVFMIAEWRTTKGTVLVDVHLWLKDQDGYHAVYPTDSTLGFPGEVASPQGTGKKQWGEQEIRTDLVRGAKYEVNVRVQPKGSTPPYVKNPDVDGAQFPFVY